MNRFNLGGPTYNAAYLTRYLPPEYETLLVGGMNEPSEKNSEFIVHQLGVKTHVIPGMQRELSPLKDRRAYREIQKIIRQFRPHIVHTHASKAGALGRLAAIRMGVPVIVHTFHGHVFDSYFSQLKAGMYRNIERLLARYSSGIVALSQAQKEDLAIRYRICSEDKIRVIPLGFDLSRFRENQQQNRLLFRSQYDIADDELAIGIVGRIVPIKNHLMFLKALKLLVEQYKGKIRAFIVGEGESSIQVRQAASQLGLDHTYWPHEPRRALLTFTGWITSMEQVNAGLDLIALTSLNEGTPVNLIEAQAAGKPIVCTRVGGVENVVIPGKTALLVDKNDHQAMAHHMAQLAKDERMRSDFSKGGWDHVKDRFHYSRLVTEMEAYYRELLEKNNHAFMSSPFYR